MKQKHIDKIRQLLTYQKSPPDHRGNYAYIYELSNHLILLTMPMCSSAFRTGAFCTFKKN